jgi:cation transporter-like permease
MTEEKSFKLSRNQKLIIAAILLSALTGIVIGYLRTKGLDSTALLYIGIPTIIGLAFATTSSSASAVGATLKAITFVILMSGPLLQEGFICMIMAAPILYIVGALAAWPFDHYRKKKERDQDASKLNMFIVPALLFVLSMEGVTDYTTFNRHNVIERMQVVEGSVIELKNKLANNRAVPSPDSLFAKIFPRPEVLHAQGLAVGDRHWIDVSYFKWIYWNEKRGSAEFKVTAHEPGYITFKPGSDNSYLHSYLDWGEVTVSFEPVTQTRTRVTWQINFTRKLDPAWYVQPLQRYAVGELAETLIASLK